MGAGATFACAGAGAGLGDGAALTGSKAGVPTGFGFALTGTAVGAGLGEGAALACSKAGVPTGFGFAFAVALNLLADFGFSGVPVGGGVAVALCGAQDCHNQVQHIALAGTVRSINADAAKGTVTFPFIEPLPFTLVSEAGK